MAARKPIAYKGPIQPQHSLVLDTPAIPAYNIVASDFAPVEAAKRLAQQPFEYKSRPKPEAPKRFIPSPQQADFFNAVRTGRNNIILQAVAGAGKTTTLIEALRLMNGQVFFGAYNKKIADELIIKAGEAGVARNGIWMGTMHSAGFRAFRGVYKNTRVDDKKVATIYDAFVKSHLPNDQIRLREISSFIYKMVSFGKQYLLGVVNEVDNLAPWRELVDHFSMDQDLPEDVEVDRALLIAIDMYKRSHKACPDVIDFDDMIYAPLAYNARFFQYNWVLMDEAQDANLARRIMAKRMLAPGGRFIGVGDEKQAIYGFTGAGGDSLQKLKEMFNCTEMPLTVTYRCAQKIVEHAHQWVDHIRAKEGAVEGSVRDIAWTAKSDTPAVNGKPWFQTENLDQEDAILCRFTKPLVACAYAMLRAGIACRIEGRDIGKNLVKLATRWKISRIDTLNARLDDYLDNEIRKAQLKSNTKREEEVCDQVATLRIFIDRCREKRLDSIQDLVNEIESLFADNVTNVVVLCTGHKAKGREWPRVFWLQTGNRMKPGQPWQEVEECNLKYVITTRAMQELVLVAEQPKEKK
jgi:DNA helicase-2/ATP-dependent DNA helicase PcrA